MYVIYTLRVSSMRRIDFDILGMEGFNVKFGDPEKSI